MKNIVLTSLALHGSFDLASFANEWRTFWESTGTQSYRDGATKVHGLTCHVPDAFPAAKAGMKTLLIERDLLGGACPNRGCVPSKLLIGFAKAARHVRDAGRHYIDADFRSIDAQRIFETENDWPYVQHRGGPFGFVRVLGPQQIGFAELKTRLKALGQEP